MKKLFALFVSVSTITMLAACGSAASKKDAPKSDGLKLESKDVKGIIQADSASVGNYTLITNDPNDPSKTVSYDGLTVRFGDKASISIAPTLSSFDSLKASTIESLKTWGTYDVVETTANSFYYHSSSEFGGTKTEGYNFIVVIKGKTKLYRITGEGSDPLKPITSKQDADKAYKAALSFVPTE